MTTQSDQLTDEVQLAVDDPRRVVALDGVHNFRDLGGYPAAGGTTRWGLVYRAAGLQRLTAADITILRARGLGAVIDLRTDAELAERGRFPIGEHAVLFHHLPVLDTTWRQEDVPDFDNAHDFLMWAYADMVNVGANQMASALRIIAESDAAPLVFHCAAGKDRTGLVAALLLSALGVPPPYIAADYGKTAEAMKRMRAAWVAVADERAAADGGVAPELPEATAHFYASPPGVMSAFLEQLTREYGSVVEFIRGIGVTDDHITLLRRRLIDPA